MQVLKQDIKERILNCSKKLFLKYGYKKTSMSSIAEKAKISKSNLYNYFEKKEDIFYTITDDSAVKLKKLTSYFKNKNFDTIFDSTENAAGFIINKISTLTIAERESVLLIITCAEETKYKTLIKNIKKTFAEKFAYIIKDECQTKLLSEIISENLINGISKIIKEDNEPDKIKQDISSLFKYHINGLISLA